MRAALLLMLLLLAPAALGLGISPARIMLQQSDTEFTFRSVPSQGEEGTIAVRAEGDLADLITFERTILRPGEEIKGRIAIPADLTPGDHRQDIIITLTEASTGTVSARAEVAAALVVQVPYPEEYLTAGWSISQDTATLITVMLQNLGSRQTTPAVTVTITGYDTEETIGFDESPIEPAGFAKLERTYASELRPGVYTAELIVEYAGQRIVQSKEQAFGKPAITLEAEYLDESGPIKPIDISGTTGWNRPLDMTAAVYVDGSPAPALKETFSAEDTFRRRLYLDTAAGTPHVVTVIVSAGGAEVAVRHQVEASVAPSSSLWWVPVAAVIAIAALTAALLWRRKSQGL